MYYFLVDWKLNLAPNALRQHRPEVPLRRGAAGAAAAPPPPPRVKLVRACATCDAYKAAKAGGLLRIRTRRTARRR
jgi:hypothetical protein